MEENIHSEIMEYKSSKSEMQRRKKAFTKLVVSFFLAIGIGSFDVIVSMSGLLLPIMGLLALILALVVVKVYKVLDHQANLRIILSDCGMEWQYENSCRKCLFIEIETIRIKRTTKSTIREIRVGLSNKELLYINGLENSESFVHALVEKNRSKKVTELKEWLNFDHPFFYIILGIVLGVMTTSIFRIALSWGESTLRGFQVLCSGYLMIAGVFILLKKPFRGRYGKTAPDDLFGSFLLIVGALIMISILIF